MMSLPHVRILHTAEFDRRLEDIEHGCYYIELSTVGCAGKLDFFEVIRSSMPQDPELNNESWHAMEDSIYNGISDLGESEVSIFWKDYYGSPRLPIWVKYMAVYVFNRIADELIAEYPESPSIDTKFWLRGDSNGEFGSGEPLTIPRPPYQED